MQLTRVIKQEVDCIQYDGTNIKEVYDFINEHHGNANEITFEDFIKNNKRPDDCPIDKNCSKEEYSFLHIGITWLPGEEYFIYLNNDNNDFCHWEGIRKGDWFVEQKHTVESYDRVSFNMLCEDEGWKLEE